MMNANHISHKNMKGIHMNFSQLQSIVALAETGNFTEAAYAIDLTQSAVSHAIATLERELGVTLFERNRKGVVALTDVGQKIIPHVRALLAQAEAIEQEAKAARGEAAGKVRVGNIQSLVAPNLLASLLTRFQSQYPAIDVVLFEGTMHEVGEWIENSIIDVGFVLLSEKKIETTPITTVSPCVLAQPGHRLHRTREIYGTLITTDELCVLVPSGHRLHERTAVTKRDLREEGFILEKTQCMYDFMKLTGFEPGKIKIHYEVSDSATILAMVREGLGITLMPRMRLPKKLEGIVALPLDPPQHILLGLATMSPETASRGALLFLQTAMAWSQEQTAQLPPSS
jgi:DNA-binding transcriptional LysR family regulator